MTAHNFWARGGVEPSLKDLLSDPILILVMNRDGITRVDVEEAIGKAQRALTTRSGQETKQTDPGPTHAAEPAIYGADDRGVQGIWGHYTKLLMPS